MTDDKVFFNGWIPKALTEKDPEFVMGKGSINIDNMIETLNSMRQHADNGWINYQIFTSKKDPSKRYAQLNTWKPSGEQINTPSGYEKFKNYNKPEELPTIQVEQEHIDVDDIPFN